MIVAPMGKQLVKLFCLVLPSLTISLFPRRENVQIQGLKYYLEQQQAVVVQQAAINARLHNFLEIIANMGLTNNTYLQTRHGWNSALSFLEWKSSSLTPGPLIKPCHAPSTIAFGRFDFKCYSNFTCVVEVVRFPERSQVSLQSIIARCFNFCIRMSTIRYLK